MFEKLKKFGLGHCDLPTMLWNVSSMLRAFALNIDSKYTRRIPIPIYISSIVITTCYFYTYLVSMLWFVSVKCREAGGMVSAMVVFSLGISSEIGAVKLFFMFMYKAMFFFYSRQVKDIVDGYLGCNAMVERGTRFSTNLHQTLRNVKKRAIVFWLVIIFNGVVYILKPLITPGRHLPEDRLILLGLEPVFETPNFQISSLITYGGVIFTCYIPANITAFLIVIAGYTEAQILALSQELTYIWDDAEKHYQQTASEHSGTRKTEVINSIIKSKLEGLVDIHTRNIDLMQKIENVFKGPIALEFGFLSIGLIAELLGGLENTYIEMPFALMQVAMDCLTGQRLVDASNLLEASVYDCKWENFNVSNRKTVLMMLQISQKNLKLSAGGVTELNFMCLMTVIRTIYSAYTALRSTMK